MGLCSWYLKTRKKHKFTPDPAYCSYFQDTDPENDLLNQKHISVSSVTNYFDAES